MKIKDLLRKKVLVVGLKKSGYSVAQLLRSYGAEVTVTEFSYEPEFENKKRFLENENIKVEIGGHSKEFVAGNDIAVLSPGIPKDSQIMQMLKEENIPCVGEIEASFHFCDTPIIAITGSNGKTTTTSMVNHVLTKCGYKSVAAGNIGLPFSQVLLSRQKYDYICLEISSFQLEDIVDFQPKVSVLLNVSEDHMDRYLGMEDYLKAKLRIFENQKDSDYCLINSELAEHFDNKECKKISFSVYEDADITWEPEKAFIKYDDVNVVLSDLINKTFFGLHSWENVLAVLGVASVLNLPFKKVVKAVNSFSNLPHRLELVGVVEDICFYNDSKATNIGAVHKALDSFNQKNILLILGGQNKNGDFGLLKEILAEKVKTVVIYGESRFEIGASLQNAVSFSYVENFEDAVYKAYDMAEKNDVVLLSPGCASFDCFESYAERGEMFKSLYREIKKNFYLFERWSA